MTTNEVQLHFHGDEVAPSSAKNALFHVIPAPLEKSVSYGTGTALGPEEILRASSQLELFDCKSVPAEHGIYTHSTLECNSVSVEESLGGIRTSVRRALDSTSIPVVLGGEHTVSFAAVEAVKEKHADFGVIHFDAHADLREEYEGSRFSHACVMKRVFDLGIPIMQIGTRSYSLEEQLFRERKNIPYFDAERICIDGADVVRIPDGFPEKIYLSFDIDVLDASIMPATGTPVPGGLSWYQAMRLIERVMETRVCLGFDAVEFSPVQNLHGCSFAVAQLVYNVMGHISRSVLNKKYWNLPV